MSAFAPIVLGAVTFTPSSIDAQGVAKLFATGSGGFDTRQGISLSVKIPKAGGTVARVTAKVVVPVLDSVTGLKTGEAIATAEFVLPKVAGSSERNQLLSLLESFLGDPAVVAAVEDLESIY